MTAIADELHKSIKRKFADELHKPNESFRKGLSLVSGLMIHGPLIWLI